MYCNGYIKLLQLSENFCLPMFNIKNTVIEFVKHIEHNFVRLKVSNIRETKNRIFFFDQGDKTSFRKID